MILKFMKSAWEKPMETVTQPGVHFLNWVRSLGDVPANVMTVLDGLVVIGGGVSKAYPLFIEFVLSELNGKKIS